VGLVVLTNVQNANLFCAAVRFRALELAFGQPTDMDLMLSARREQAQHKVRNKSAQVQPLDRATAASHQGFYAKPALSEVRLTLQDDRLMLQAGGCTSELRSLGEATYVLWDPPLSGALIQFTRENPGEPAFVFTADDPDVQDPYRFTKVPSPTAATRAHRGGRATSPGAATRTPGLMLLPGVDAEQRLR
jgi:hypothetical protein